MRNLDEVDELDLIHAAIEGDERAFEAVVNHYAARLRWLIRLRLDPVLRTRIGVDDILQEAMLVASKRIGSLTVESEAAFWTWLCRVTEQRLAEARRRHLRAAKRDARREARPAPPPPDRSSSQASFAALFVSNGSSPSQHLRTQEQRQSLEAALASLPESFRDVIVLRILEGFSVQETATIMGRSPGAIGVLLTKAVKRLGSTITARRSPSSAGELP